MAPGMAPGDSVDGGSTAQLVPNSHNGQQLFAGSLLQALEIADPGQDKLAAGLASLGFLAVTMIAEGKIVPCGYFKITDMFKAGSEAFRKTKDGKQAKEVKPAHFSSSPETKRQIQLIAADFHIAESTVIMSFVGDPYKGTWVHPRLAILAAQYLDRSTFNTGELGYYMAKALHQHSSQGPTSHHPLVMKTLGNLSGAVIDIHHHTKGFVDALASSKQDSSAALLQVSQIVQETRAEMQQMAAEQRRLSRKRAEDTPLTHATKRPFTMVEAATEAMPQDPGSLILLLNKTGQIAVNGNFQSMMDIIPIQLGIMKRSERGGAPVFHGSLKRPVMERMMEIFLVHNNELA